jgi:hypothetical protein
MPIEAWPFAALNEGISPLCFAPVFTDERPVIPGRCYKGVLERRRSMESPDQEQRCLPELRAYIVKLLAKGWVIAERSPLTLQSGCKTYRVVHGMLLGDEAF